MFVIIPDANNNVETVIYNVPEQLPVNAVVINKTFIYPTPVEGKLAKLKYDPATNDTFYIYEDAPVSMEQQLATLVYANKTATERFKELPVDTSLTDYKIAKQAQLKEACDAAIEDGFISTSLGYKFGFKVADQNNIYGQMFVFMNDETEVDCQWKTEDAGVQTFTKAQFLKIVPEGKAHVREKTGKYWTLVAQVDAATTKTAVDSIVW